MKNKKLLLSIFLVCIYALLINMSCKKDQPANVIEFFTLNVNNIPLKAKSIATKVRKGGAGKNYIQVMATLTNDELAFVEIFYDEISERSVLNVSADPRADFGYQAQTINSNEWYEASVNYKGCSGTMTISKNDLNTKTIEGAFSGTVVNITNTTDKKIITDGNFAIRY